MARYFTAALAAFFLSTAPAGFAQTAAGGGTEIVPPSPTASNPAPDTATSLPGVTDPATTGSTVASPGAQGQGENRDVREACHSPGTQSDSNPTATLPTIPSRNAACN